MNQRFVPKQPKYDEELQAEIERLAREQDRLILEMGSKWDQKKALVMNKICSNNLRQKEAIFQQQTLKFFKDSYSIDLEGFFSPKPSILNFPNTVFQQESIIIYGVDFLSPAKIYNYFKYFLPTNLSWINDSSCKLTFKYCNAAKRAILQNLSSEYHRVFKVQKCVWYRLRPYHVLGFQRPLQARIATNFDVTVTQIQDSKYDVYEQARKAYLEQIQSLGKMQVHPIECQPIHTNHNPPTFSNLNQNNIPQYQQNQKLCPPQNSQNIIYEQIDQDENFVMEIEQQDIFETNQSRIYQNKNNMIPNYNCIDSQEESIVNYLSEMNIKAPKAKFKSVHQKQIFK